LIWTGGGGGVSHGIVGRVDPDLKLLQDALTGDRRAEEIFAAAMIEHLHHSVAGWFALYGLRGRIQHDIDDVVQSALLALLEDDAHRLREYDPSLGLSVRGWVDLIGKRTLLDILRTRQEKMFRREERDEARVDAEPTGIGETEDARIAGHQLTVLRERLVEPEDRIILEMRLERRSTAEIAFVLKCTNTAAASRIARWVDRVRKILGDG
jgi:RNA polymerase sigma factor (sigma-70 family)